MKRARVFLRYLAVLALVTAGIAAIGWHQRERFPIGLRKGIKAELELSGLRLRVTGNRPSIEHDSSKQVSVAHAGGAYLGKTYTNSLQALDESYGRGFRYFELDFSRTTDGHYVVLHDWNIAAERFLGAPKQLSLDEFRAASASSQLSHPTLDELLAWLEAHPDACLVTDTKGDNIAFLRALSARAPGLKDRVVPQVYRFSEYGDAVNLGYERIILSLYRSGYPDRAVLKFARHWPVFAITMSTGRASIGTLAQDLDALGVTTFAHPVSDPSVARALLDQGFDGIYTYHLLLSTELQTPEG